MRNILLFMLLTASVSIVSATREQQLIYKKSFDELIMMQSGQKLYDFKRAVFISENAFCDNCMDYKEFCDEIDRICRGLRQLILLKNFQSYKTSGNWAAFTYLTEPLQLNNYAAYTYNYDDFMCRKNYSSGFVTSLMRDKKGNCYSFPIFFKILSEELGSHTYIAHAPLHLYAKHKDEQGNWTNVELTNGTFVNDIDIIKRYEQHYKATPKETYGIRL